MLCSLVYLLVGSWITQKTLPARGAAYVCKVRLKSLTSIDLNEFKVNKFQTSLICVFFGCGFISIQI